MKKISSKKMKIVWGSLGASILLVPTIAISAVACSSEKNPINKPIITISAQPKNEIIFLNQPENLPTLSINATTNDSNAQLTYQWYENASNSTTGGTAISGATNSTYTIPQSDVTKTGTKYYYAVVSAIIGDKVTNSINSEISTLIISDKIPPIAITSHSKDQDAIIGQTQNLPTFSVDVTTGFDNQRLTYQWYSNASNSTTGGTVIEGATNSSYTVASSNTSSEGKTYFYVKVSGTLNGLMLTEVTSDPMILTISKVPAIVVNTQPIDQVAYVNQTENLPSFNVVATPINNATFTYQWYSNTSNSTTGGTAIQGATKSSYQITPADVGSSETTKYFYVVVSGVINGVALTPLKSSVVSLTIKAKPTVTIKTQPSNQTVLMNQTSAFPTFSVVAIPIENATFTYQWYSNTSNSTTGGTVIESATNANYQTSPSDIGSSADSVKYFYVTVGGSIGDIKLTSVTSSVVSLTTKANSVITISTQPTAERVVAKDASVTLTAAATTTSSSELSYQWQKSNKVLTDPVWTNIAGANSNTYTFDATDEPGTITYYRVIVSESITNATATSSEAKVSVGYASADAAMPVLNAWLASKDNQRNLLNSYFAKDNVNPLSIFTTPTSTTPTGAAVWGYNFNALPTATLNSITFTEATTDNTLPADTWEIKATTTTVGTYQVYDNSTDKFGDSIQIPIGTVFTFYLPFSFKENVTITTTVNASLVAHITRTINLTNGSSTLSFATDARIPIGKIQGSFTPPGASATTVSFTFSNPLFYSFSNTNSDLPTYPIIATSSSR